MFRPACAFFRVFILKAQEGSTCDVHFFRGVVVLLNVFDVMFHFLDLLVVLVGVQKEL